MDKYKEISLKEMFDCIWNKIWLIALTTVVFGSAAFFITNYSVEPQYKATIRLYVNNRTESTNLLTTSDVAAAKSLVDTYITIIESNSVLEDIVNHADFECTPNEIRKMMSAKSINGTEVFEVSITGTIPEKCALIANMIAQLAPSKITEIVDGSSVKIIDRAKIPTEPISPNISKNVTLACALGFFISSFVIILVHMFDTAIYNEDDFKEFCKLPVLGLFFDFNQINGNKNSYLYGGRSKGR